MVVYNSSLDVPDSSQRQMFTLVDDIAEDYYLYNDEDSGANGRTLELTERIGVEYKFVSGTDGKTLPEEVTQGTLEGDLLPGDITFFRLQSTADNILRGYIAQGEILPVATRSFGSIGVFAIPEMGRFYRHVLIEGNYPHHGAVAFGKYGKALFEVFKYIGVPVEEIGYNRPKGDKYPTENPW